MTRWMVLAFVVEASPAAGQAIESAVTDFNLKK